MDILNQESIPNRIVIPRIEIKLNRAQLAYMKQAVSIVQRHVDIKQESKYGWKRELEKHIRRHCVTSKRLKFQ